MVWIWYQSLSSTPFFGNKNLAYITINGKIKRNTNELDQVELAF